MDDAGERDVTTTFGFGPFALLERIVRSSASATTTTELSYDVRGRREKMIDPDVGAITTQYNGYGEPYAEQTPATDISYRQDRLGRVTLMRTNEGDWETKWDVRPGGIGAGGRDVLESTSMQRRRPVRMTRSKHFGSRSTSTMPTSPSRSPDSRPQRSVENTWTRSAQT